MSETKPLIYSDHPVVLVGPVDVDQTLFERVFETGLKIVAADGGANAALARGVVPDAVIGDFDSVQPDPRLTPDILHRIEEQDSTDFEKCLSRISAPRVLAIGFLGARMDHNLAVFSTLARYPAGSCILIGHHDVIVHCPLQVEIDLKAGTRVSLFPMASVTGQSKGLHWPIDGIDMSPAGRIGTSNRATGRVVLDLDGPGMLLSLPPDALAALLDALPPVRATG